MKDSILYLTLDINPGADADTAEWADLGGRLREELLDSDAESVEVASGGAAPPGTKAVEMLAVGRVIVAVARSIPQLRSVVAAVRDWMGRQSIRSVKITIDGDVLEITNVSPGDQARLVDSWISRHADASR